MRSSRLGTFDSDGPFDCEAVAAAYPAPLLRPWGSSMTPPPPLGNQLSRTLSAVDHLVARIRHEQWLAPTPCTDWNVHDLVNHLVGMNLVFAALMSDQPPPQRGADRLGNDPLGAYRDSGVALAAAFDQPGVLERTFHGPLGAATGAERLNIRIADLLVHGWDLSQATGQPTELPEDLAEEALAFVRAQLLTQPRTGRYGPEQAVGQDAPAIDRLAAFLGRPVRTSRRTGSDPYR
jgi:uncharacterized protein (TIGR03086 family)